MGYLLLSKVLDLFKTDLFLNSVTESSKMHRNHRRDLASNVIDSRYIHADGSIYPGRTSHGTAGLFSCLDHLGGC